MSDQGRDLGREYRKDSERRASRLIFFSALLILSHLLSIKPSELDAGGIKVAVEDPAIVRGTIATVYFYYLFSTVTLYMQGALLAPFNIDNAMIRAILTNRTPFPVLLNPDRKKPGPRELKRVARRWLRFYNLINGPFQAALMFLALAALILAFSDAWSLVSRLS
jgi:hypothetical protein